jgi:hypothetical protein
MQGIKSVCFKLLLQPYSMHLLGEFPGRKREIIVDI